MVKKIKLNSDDARELERDIDRVMEGVRNMAEKGWLDSVHVGKPKNGLVRVEYTINHPGTDIAEREIANFRVLADKVTSSAYSSKAYLSKKGGTNV